jgi:RNA polymerase sigma-70 factor (ECF subfamily)
MNELPETRQSLLVRLGERSDDAWAEFLAIYEQAIRHYCRAKGLQDADARDVTQNVLTAVAKHIDRWDPDPRKGSFRGWLLTVARNIVVDSLVDLRRRATAGGASEVEELLAELPDSEETDASAFLLEYRRLVFHRVAEQVKREVRKTTWQAFWMTTLEAQKPEQVAQVLGVSVGSVYTAKCRVVARIRAKIADLDVDDSCTLELEKRTDQGATYNVPKI